MKTQLPSKYPWKSSCEPLGVCKSQLENPCCRQLCGVVGVLLCHVYQ